jgi:hypothetical protein
VVAIWIARHFKQVLLFTQFFRAVTKWCHTSSSISDKCNDLTLQLHAVSERMEEHELNFAQISPRISEMPRLVFRVWKHWIMKCRHWMVLHSHSISFGRLTVRSLWCSRKRNFGNAFNKLRTTECFMNLDIGELYESFSTHQLFKSSVSNGHKNYRCLCRSLEISAWNLLNMYGSDWEELCLKIPPD